MSPEFTLADMQKIGFPRVSGDEPPIADSGHLEVTFSPRERG